MKGRNMRILVILLLCFLLAAPHAVYADAITQVDNSFFNRHQNDILPLGRSFIVDGEDGSVEIKEKPGTAEGLYQIENGDIVFVHYSCLFDGEYWGFINAGWVRLDQMLVLYDNISFVEDHADEFYSYEGTYEALEKAGGAVAWSWPGSGVRLRTIGDMQGWEFNRAYTWTDPEGREWGLERGYQGFSDSWVCLSDPMNGDMPAFNPAPPPAVWVSDKEHVDLGKTRNPMVLLAVVLIAAVAVVTIVLIRNNRKHGKDKGENQGGAV